MEWKNKIKVIIFDLDGTLYQDKVFYKRYVQHLIKDTSWEAKEEVIINEVEKILNGEGGYKLGNLFNTENEKSQSTLNKAIEYTEVYKSNGDFEDLLHRKYNFTGDAWGAVYIVAHKLGISGEKLTEAFNKVREEMITEEYSIEYSKELINVVGELKKYMKKIYLFTNTPREAAEGFTRYLDLGNKIDVIQYGKDKPFGLIKSLPEIIKTNSIDPTEILAIGDHGYNDLYPIKRLGGQTILTTPYNVQDNMEWTARVSTLDELKSLLEEILEKSKERKEMVS